MRVQLTNRDTGKTLTMYKDNVLDAMKALQRYLNQQKYDRNSSIYSTTSEYVLEHNGHKWIGTIKKRTQ